MNEKCLLHQAISVLQGRNLIPEDLKTVDNLIEDRIGINDVDEKGRTPLMMVLDLIRPKFEGEPHSKEYIHQVKQLTESLLEAGADPSFRFKDGSTILMSVARFRSPYELEIVKLLVDSGIDPNVQDNCGWTAVIHAALHSNKEMIEMLLAVGADVNMKDKKGQRAVSFSCYRRNVVKLLLLKGRNQSMYIEQIMMDHFIDFEETELLWYLVTDNNPLAKMILPHDKEASTIFETENTLSLVKIFYQSGVQLSPNYTYFLEEEDEKKQWKNGKKIKDIHCPAGHDVEQFEIFRNNLSLKSRCVRVIRDCIGCGIRSKIYELKVPDILINTILLKSVIPEKYFKLIFDNDMEATILYRPTTRRFRTFLERAHRYR